jgi:uncharacterized protein YbjT (DUF2867 family)
MSDKRVAVIGASGFIGRYVVKRLASRGDVITAIMRHIDSGKFLQPMGDVGQIARVRASIADDKQLTAALAGSDAVVNLAGILYEHGAQRFDIVHHEGARRVGRIATAVGVKRVVHVSALGAAAGSPSSYAKSKAAGETAIAAEYPGVTILRPSVVFGPEDDFFNRFGAMAQYFPALPLIGGGKTRFQPVYVSDVAAAVVAALDDPATAGRIYEIGGPIAYTFRELMEIVLTETRRKRPLVSLPWGLATLQASILELLPVPLLTRDQVRLLKSDNVVAPGALTLRDLGIVPTTLEAIIPTYMDRYRRGGWFGAHGMETR